MARYVSKFRKYKITYQRDETQHLAGPDGSIVKRELRPLIVLEFEFFGALAPWEKLAAFKQWGGVASAVEISNIGGHRPDGSVATEMYTILAPVMGFGGQGQELDEATPLDPTTRLSIFDTDRFCEQHGYDKATTGKQLEEFLDTNPDHGHGYIKVELPVMPLPWPAYAKLRGVRGRSLVETIRMRVEEMGFAPQNVIAYEQAHPRRESEEIITEMRRLLDPAAGSPEELEIVPA